MSLVKIPDQLVIIPVFNEQSTIESVINEIRRYYAGDILVVDDGSTDNSAKIIKSLADTQISLLSHCTNLGYGQSLIDAFSYATGKGYTSIVTIDCDWQHEPRFIPQFFDELKNADVVSGSRYYFNTLDSDNTPKDRFRINKIITSEINEITGWHLSDTFCGFKAYRVCALKRLCLTEPGYAMPLQFWVQAHHVGLRIKELPITRIYLNLDRQFGSGLDDPEKRLNYYRQIISNEISNVKKCNANRCASR